MTPDASASVPRARRLPLALTGGLLALLSLAGCMAPPVHHRPYPPGEPPPAPQTRAEAPMYFYPERGQSDERQDRDRYECYRWAVRETGVDPGMTPVRQALPPPVPAAASRRDGAEVVGGAVTGAAIGAAMSGPRHAGPNAVIGAVFGAILGASAQESRVQAAEQAQARREARWESAQQPLQNFRRAMGACMQGRGYRLG